MNFFVLDNSINSRTLGLRTTLPPILPTSRQIINSITVDGREGTLTNKRGWEDLPIRMQSGLLSSGGKDLYNRFRELLPKLLNAKTVYFSGDPEVFYNVKHVRVDVLERRLNSLLEFALTFTCSPFKYIRNIATIEMYSPYTVVNIGTVYSLPKITVFGTGSQTLTINGKAITLNILAGSLTLDSELKTCYFGNVAQNNRMQGDFPVFEVGNNSVSFGSGITKLEIEPRWRHI